MLQVQDGKLDLDQRVVEILPDFGEKGKESITVRNLLVHDSGLIAFRPYHRTLTQPEEVVKAVYAEGLQYATGTKSVYSDLNMIAMARILEVLSGKPLDQFLRERVFGPLALTDTIYNPHQRPDLVARCAPTETVEPWRRNLRKLRGTFLGAAYSQGNQDGHYIQAEVHDPTATVLGGAAGHAGLFSTVGDLCRFMTALTKGVLVKPEIVETFTKRQSELSSRALGWDTKSEKSSAGTLFGPRSFGHTGYTGTSVWYDPDRDLFAILLTNRVHPTSENTKIIAFRPKFHDAVVKGL
jgi:CubicO group peptidase (beta-lactamase class C family)